MGVPSPTRTLLSLLCLVVLVFALSAPAAGRSPRMKDVREGDPGDGVLSPRVSAPDVIGDEAPAPEPEPATTAAPTVDTNAAAGGRSLLILSPVHGAWFFPTNAAGWTALVQDWLPWSAATPDGGWRDAR
jgi:hypothetical protein